MIVRIYLGGPINGCTDDEAMTWREWFKGMRPDQGNICAPFKRIDFVDPMKRDYRGKEASNYREIVDLDKQDIRSCDIIVIMYTKPSVGTSMETLYAWELGKTILVINESGAPLSPWLLYHSTAIVSSKEEGAVKLREWLK